MEVLDRETQLIAVEKVLEEMHKAEEYVQDWKASWLEQLSDAHCLPLHYEIGECDVRNMEEKYGLRYKLANAFYSGESIGVPLAKETLIGNDTLTGERCRNFDVEFGRIDWYDMNSHKSTRHFSFSNNGIIEFSKSTKVGQKQTLQHPSKISYSTSFDVLSSDFSISITLDKLIEDWREKYKYDYLTLSLKGNILTEKFNDIEITRNLSTGMWSVRIVKKYDKRHSQNNASVAFEAALNSDDSLEFGAVAIETHKGNGKVNGTYRFDVSRKKGIRANFYSRKGVKVDLTTNPLLLETANNLLLPVRSSSSRGDIIISDFATSTEVAIAKNLSEKIIKFDSSDFNMESVNQVEKKIMTMVKCIKGELPLPGLVDRIDNCIKLIDKKPNPLIKDSTNYKVLKLALPKK